MRSLRSLRTRLVDTGLSVYDIEFAVIDANFKPGTLAPIPESAAELGAKRLGLCGDDPDGSRLIGNFAALCDLAAGFGSGSFEPQLARTPASSSTPCIWRALAASPPMCSPRLPA
jgi:hypothetical protein